MICLYEKIFTYFEKHVDAMWSVSDYGVQCGFDGEENDSFFYCVLCSCFDMKLLLIVLLLWNYPLWCNGCIFFNLCS